MSLQLVSVSGACRAPKIPKHTAVPGLESFLWIPREQCHQHKFLKEIWLEERKKKKS